MNRLLCLFRGHEYRIVYYVMGHVEKWRCMRCGRVRVERRPKARTT